MTLPNPEKVLVVDDDAAIRVVVTRLLAKHGIEVLSARNVEEAINHLQMEPRISRLLVDLNLAEAQRGTEVAEVAQKLRPDLDCIFMSGESINDLTEIQEQTLCSGLLKKPFRAQELIEILAIT